MRQTFVCAVLSAVVLMTSVTASQAAPTREQRKQLSLIQKEVVSVASLIRKKEYAEAEKKLDELNAQAKKLITEAQFSLNERSVVSLSKLLKTKRQQVAKALGKPDPTLVSFSRDIAPVLQARCGNCHSGDTPRGELDLSSFAMMKRGGKSGILLVPRNAKRSRLMARLATTDTSVRMPRGANALERPVIEKMFNWINEGAIFDGDDESTPLSDLSRDGTSPEAAPPVQIAKATGNEKVSFVKDIAPTMVNLCIGCHGGRNANAPSGGLTLTTFEGLMRGGESGRVIVPGNLDGSRLWDLVGITGDMPQGQALITRKFHANLRVWIEEGAKFDGDNARATLRSLVPTDAAVALTRLAGLSAEEFRTLREERTAEQWKRVFSGTTVRFVSSEEFLVYGNASDVRLKQVSDWAEQYLQELRSTFGIKERPVWRGRLTIFVTKERFGYTELNQTLHRRGTAKDVHGHAFITTGFEDAYIALEDVGDEPGETHGGLQLAVMDHITGAYLQKPGTRLPQWLIRGTGLALGSRKVGNSTYIDALGAKALNALKGIRRPEDVFTAGRFGPGDVGPIGYSLVSFMINAGGPKKFGQFITRLQSGSNVAAAVKAVYAANLKNLGTAYRGSLK